MASYTQKKIFNKDMLDVLFSQSLNKKPSLAGLENEINDSKEV
jgi:hypothetical protein